MDIHGELARFHNLAFDRNHPVGSVEFLRVFRRVGLIRAEFVEIIVVRDLLVGVFLFRGAKRAFEEAAELCRGNRGLGGRGQLEQAAAGDSRGADDPHGLEEFPPIQVNLLGGNIRIGQIRGFADQHLTPPMLILPLPIMLRTVP